jgi:multidrug transporter EmrE-like cation transporter
MDADLTQPPAAIPRMVDEHDSSGADVVIASRFRTGSKVHGLSAFRRLMTTGARLVMSTLLPASGVRDYSCGFRLYDRRVLAQAFEDHGDAFVMQAGFACMVEIIGRLRGRARFSEVPFELHYEEKRSPSAMKVGRTVRAYFDVISTAWRDDLARSQVASAAGGRNGIAYAVLVAGVTLGVLGQILVKTGLSGTGPAGFGATLAYAATSPEVVVGVLLYATSSAFWLLVLSQVNLSIAYPLGASAYLLVVAAGLYLGEPVGTLRWLGAMVIVGGIILVAMGENREGKRRE